MPVDEIRFREIFKEKLGSNLERALTIMNNFGPRLSFDVINVLMHASDKEKVEEVLKLLEEHWENRLQFQHPETRGLISSPFGNPTQQMFLRICIEVLGLTPSDPAPAVPS